MKIKLQEANLAAELQHFRWDLALVGNAVDERGKAAVEFAQNNSDESRVFTYSPETFRSTLGAASQNAEQTEELLRAEAGKKLLLETTTLGFVEIFLATRALLQLGIAEFYLLYVEPGEYASPRRSNLLYRREFELSDTVPGWFTNCRTIHSLALKLGST